jgi:hypothetical protein
MTFDVTQTMQEAFTELLAGIFGSEAKALAFVTDPNGELQDKGLANQDLASVNVQQAVVDACNYPGVPEYAKEHLQSYSADSYTAAPQTIESVVEQVTQVTQIVYQDNDVITNEIQNNNTNIAVGDNFNGDIDVDNQNVDDGGVGVQGDNNDVVAATGPGSVAAGDDINAPVNTGVIDGGILADGDVTNAVAGSGNQVGAQASDNATIQDNVTGFGSGSITSVNDSTVEDSAVGPNASNISDLDDVAFGPNSTNVSDNELDEGSAISTAGDATGNFNDNSTEDNDNINNNVNNSEDVNVAQEDSTVNDNGEEPDPISNPLL